MTNAAAILRRHQTLKTQRQTSVENVWRDAFDYTFPLRGNGLNGSYDSANASQEKQARIMDPTAADSCSILASGMMDGLTPANALWFAMDVGDESDEERRWLDDAAKLIWENIHLANFDAEGFECCLDMAIAGQFALFVDEDRERGGYVFQQWPLGSVYVTSTRPDGQIDIVHREYELTAEQAVNDFGEENVPEKIRRVYQTTPDEIFTFVHVIQPRKVYAVNGKLSKNMPIASCHIELSTSMLVRESGYHEMPVVVPRWLRVPRSIYAVGPMYAALPAVRQLNEMLVMETAAMDIAVSGMWLAVDDGVLNARSLKVGPRKVIVAADKDSLTPLSTGGNFELSAEKTAQLQGQIRKVLMADQLPPADGPAKTAYEYSIRVAMIRKVLGPLYGRLQAEYLKPLIDRCFGLAYRAGVFSPPPQSLANRDFAVRYVSPMARAQKLDEVDAVRATFADAAEFAKVDPSIIDELDPREALRIVREGRNAPASIQRKPEEVEQIRKAKAEAQVQSQQVQGAMAVQQAGAEAAAVKAVEAA